MTDRSMCLIMNRTRRFDLPLNVAGHGRHVRKRNLTLAHSHYVFLEEKKIICYFSFDSFVHEQVVVLRTYDLQ